MNQLLNNLQAALAALRGAKPNPASWSGPAATAFTHRVDLLEIEFTALCALVGVAAVNPTFGGGGTGSSGGGVVAGVGSLVTSGMAAVPIPGNPVATLQQLGAGLGIHF